MLSIVRPVTSHCTAHPWLRRVRFLLGTGVAASALSSLLSIGNPLPPNPDPLFSETIQPLLETHCIRCHGEGRQESHLRLDSAEGILRGGDHGPLLDPADPERSLLVTVLRGAHPEIEPMPRRAPPLTEADIGLVVHWMASGAPLPPVNGEPLEKAARNRTLDHWAFQPPTRPAVPEPSRPDWGRNAMDGFILSRLESEGLTPSPEADPATWVRRLHLDLIGLPPDPSVIDAFVSDPSDEAYSALVESLLASPHYGERWGRVWLDAARYADSDGFEKDKARFIWAYRDWVVGAFNRDLPYDRFLIEQVAGDLLPDATQDQRIATGFLRNSMINEEGGVDPEQFRMEALFDRMEAIGKAILGITIQCAQCHDHKFDPISQEDYFRMFAFLNNNHEGTETVYGDLDLDVTTELTRALESIRDPFRASAQGNRESLALWLRQRLSDAPRWMTLSLRNAGDNAQRYFHLEDGSVLSGGYAPTQWTALFHTENPVPRMTGFRLEQLPHPDLPSGGPGRSIRGMAALSEFKVSYEDPNEPGKRLWIRFTRALADFSNEGKPLEAEFDNRSGRQRLYGPVAWAIDDNPDTAWGIDAGPGRRNTARQAVFVPDDPVELPVGTLLTVHLMQNHGGWNSDDNQTHNLGRFRISITSEPVPDTPLLPPDVEALGSTHPDLWSAPAFTRLLDLWLTEQPDGQEAADRMERLWRDWPEGHTTLTLQDRHPARVTHLLRRGDWLKPGPPVSPGVPDILHPLPPDGSPDRLTFARWLASPSSPTTARVWVNRVWQSLFGTGLLDTPEDFGLQSPRPSHPELLDWLAVEFMAQGWSLKQLHRLITDSATYRQSSRIHPSNLEKDPDNRLLGRAPRLRIDGELVRDMALATAGLLQKDIGGPPVFSPADPQLFMPPNSYGPFEWLPETGGGRYRRALYTFRRRSTPYPFLATFDSPVGDASCVRRTQSNTPMQALASLHEAVFVEAAKSLARRAVTEVGPRLEDRIQFAFRQVLGRQPDDMEQAELKALALDVADHLAQGWVSAGDLAPSPLPPGTHPTEMATLTLVARVLLNLDEAIHRE